MIEHSKRTRKEGLYALFWGVVACGGLLLFQFCFFSELWNEARVFLFTFNAVLAVVVSVSCWYARSNIVVDDEFRCKLTDDKLDCYCPVKGAGETFAVQIADIAKLEKEEWSDSHRWYIWDGNGNRYWLTSNFDNPCDQIIDRIQELRPNVLQVDSN